MEGGSGLFDNREHLGHRVTVDATDTLQLLDFSDKAQRIGKPFEDRWEYRISRKLSPLGSRIVLTFHGAESVNLDDTVIQAFFRICISP